MSTRRPAGTRGPGAAPGGGDAQGRPGARHPAATAGGDAPAALDPGAVPRVGSRCAWQVVAGEAVLLDVDRRRIVGLNPVGSFVFGLVDGTHTVRDLAGAVAAHFGISEDRALADVSGFVGMLRARGLLEDGRP